MNRREGAAGWSCANPDPSAPPVADAAPVIVYSHGVLSAEEEKLAEDAMSVGDDDLRLELPPGNLPAPMTPRALLSPILSATSVASGAGRGSAVSQYSSASIMHAQRQTKDTRIKELVELVNSLTVSNDSLRQANGSLTRALRVISVGVSSASKRGREDITVTPDRSGRSPLRVDANCIRSQHMWWYRIKRFLRPILASHYLYYKASNRPTVVWK